MIYAAIFGVLLIVAGGLMTKRASSPDAASGGFGLAFLGAVVLVFALLVIFGSRVHGVG